ncbi:serine/threonine protein phosphatase [Amycolatopsis acidicola]|uniref:Serine/threonine protein phosphatase n=1 Tax=Amycolatopsis acidicola TaxID=2596893 RepID=A0A5N0UU90_9PSEU|nr:protein phosphatase 2C domain-containing protein [Amycolatopsis acidicola]KAA9153617.1 serine/threonine protein phosphatase [Amycolatopsis acidicola]
MLHPLTQTPTWHTASAQGPRLVNADAVGAYADPATQQVVFALADGVGDDQFAARAARLAAAAAVRTPAAEGPIAALLAAQRALRADPTAGDCVLVVALPFAEGYRIGWVGDVRAYAWTGSTLRQLTKDHTLAEYFRDRGEEVVPRMEHIVTTSVRTAEATAFGRAEVHGAAGLLLTSDGVHKNLSPAAMAELLRHPANAAQSLVDSALAAGGTDNATAMLVEDAPFSDLTTEAIPTAA